MATVVVTITDDRFPELIRKMPQVAERIVETTARNIETTIKTGMAASSSPSAPGDYPGIDTGTLVNSIQSERESAAAWTVHTPIEYAPYLEFGTPKMDSRPFMGQAASEEEPYFRRAFERLEDYLE